MKTLLTNTRNDGKLLSLPRVRWFECFHFTFILLEVCNNIDISMRCTNSFKKTHKGNKNQPDQ